MNNEEVLSIITTLDNRIMSLLVNSSLNEEEIAERLGCQAYYVELFNHMHKIRIYRENGCKWHLSPKWDPI